jgi:ankyrin repeat protein
MKIKSFITLLLIAIASFASAQTISQQLFEAVSKSDSAKVEILLNGGGNPNLRKKFGFLEMSMLILAVQHGDVKIVKLLVDHKAEINFRDAFKTTALMYAANKGNKPIVEILIAGKADVNAKDDQGNSVLSAAKESKNEQVIRLIEKLSKKLKLHLFTFVLIVH